MIPPTSHPWRTVEHDGERYMVREVDGVVWVSRISDRELWLYDPASSAPAHFRTPGSSTEQRPLF